jgi:hypothetical protein
MYALATVPELTSAAVTLSRVLLIMCSIIAGVSASYCDIELAVKSRFNCQ